ncbi:hypothetical protein [Nocardioides sp. Soil796]|uniref:hypothetical protein n=1 Tax=Nocardioides sp. Soil796 TaxID=1736412 RepID=UPI000708B18E|nr:hypothetical protein [Nocardioides sp. Soil796]KRF15039.1 hypothetical protein ASH02_12395 [Nocardioides sp. Soil796]
MGIYVAVGLGVLVIASLAAVWVFEGRQKKPGWNLDKGGSSAGNYSALEAQASATRNGRGGRGGL